MRKPIIAGNWKMHKTIEDAKQFVDAFKQMFEDSDVEVILCVPATQLYVLKGLLEDTNIKLGAQNMHYEENGAYTGEISPAMLKELDVAACIIGHSERREYYNETNEAINKKLIKAIEYGITPILCVGETLEEKEAGKTEIKIKNQIIEGLNYIEVADLQKIVIAYEPIWAIGTGKTATPEQANEVIAFIRETLKALYNDEISEKIRIQYGGSVKPNNITDIMNQEDIDGALVGGASLKPEDFIQIVNF